MNILYFLVGCSLLMALIFLGAFIWALKTGQNDDVYTPAIRMLFDDGIQEDEKPVETSLPKAPKSDDHHI